MKDAEILDHVYLNLKTFLEEYIEEGKDADLLQRRIKNMLDNVEDGYKEMAANALDDVANAMFEELELRNG